MGDILHSLQRINATQVNLKDLMMKHVLSIVRKTHIIYFHIKQATCYKLHAVYKYLGFIIAHWNDIHFKDFIKKY